MKKIIKALFIILLVILLLAAAFVGYLYFANSGMDFEGDDAEEIIKNGRMDLGKKLSFSADDETMSIIADKGDIYWFLQQEYGKNLFGGLEEEFESYGAELEEYRLDFGDGKAGICMKVEYLDRDINLFIPCSVELDGNRISMTPEKIKLFGITMDISKFTGGEEIEGIDAELTPVLLESFDKAEVTADGIKLTGPMSARFVGMARNGFTPEELETMLEDGRCSYAAKILFEYSKNPDSGKKMWMDYLENDPALFEIIYPQMLSMIGSEHFGNYYIKDTNHGYIFRIIPDFDTQVYFDNYDVLAAEYKK